MPKMFNNATVFFYFFNNIYGEEGEENRGR